MFTNTSLLPSAPHPTIDGSPPHRVGLLDLPAEILDLILEQVFAPTPDRIAGFLPHEHAGGILLDNTYHAPRNLQPLLTCHRLYAGGHLLALQRTTFVIANLFTDIPARLRATPPHQISALRSVAFVADARHFRKLLDWGAHPFAHPGLTLDTLTLVLHRSSFWHYLFDFTADFVTLLRALRGVRRWVVVRNAASVKGSFKAWYHRLVGLLMKVDHRERYDRHPPECGDTWWTWRFDERGEYFVLTACKPPAWVGEEEYLRKMAPLVEELRIGVEGEEWNPDPRARNGA